MDETPSDDTLANQAQSNTDAFAALYRRHVHRVYSYVLSRVGNVQDAQDLTAETFMAMLKNIDSYEPRGMFGAWVLGIAKYKTVDHFRNRCPVVAMDDVGTLADNGHSVDNIVNERLQMQELIALMEKLNPERAEALRLRYFGGLKMREIADVMGKSEGATKMLVSRALEDIQNMTQIKEEIR